MERTYNISGMTCSGCAQAVHNLLSKVEGVEKVDVQLEKGRAVLKMKEAVATETLQAALKSSPYQLSA
ncbi:MAG TPA: heavy metal-associated domain-containing protein [Anseongella sp.]|nr:heavy metal-associated domain-containing protein [Anseongella sp.]